MIVSTYILLYFLSVLHFHSDIVSGQRTFPNPAVQDPAPCSCDLQTGSCQPNCCCDPDCSNADLSVSPICQSARTVSSYSSAQEQKLQTWNCSNTTSATRYDYFPFVCVQLTQNEILGNFYSTDNVAFVKTVDSASSLHSRFVTEYPELFQATTLSSTTFTGNYSIGAPVQQTVGTPLTFPGNLIGSICQDNVPILFGINRDMTCASSSLSTNLCTRTSSIVSVLKGGDTSSIVNISATAETYVQPSTTARDFTTQYYFQDSYSPSITDISYINGLINDYCPGLYPSTRSQRYSFVCSSSNTSTCNNYQVWSGCPFRDSLQYSTIPDAFFVARTTTIDDSTNFADFNHTTTTSSITCPNTIRRVYYRFNYSSIDNTIATAEVFVQFQPSATNSRITIEWNDISASTTSSANVPRGYYNGESLQFRRNSNVSDVSILVPTSSGLCIDATRQTLSYKKSASSYCFIQLSESTIQQCHNLKLNMYLYLNAFYAPASDVLAYPAVDATLVKIRDVNQDLMDLDRIDETRPNNRLSTDTIARRSFGATAYTIYDTIGTLPVCYNVPSGIYIEFGFVRINVSSTVSYERIISVQYNYTYSNWQFDGTTTQRYLVSFQSAFVDYTNRLINGGDTTRTDITSGDNYIQHLLWLISPEYQGEQGNRKYTIGMILMFIGICVIVMHVLLFGLMCPF